jgi:polysaccharide export outer membrane protein
MGRIILPLLVILWIGIAPALVWADAGDNISEPADIAEKPDNILPGLNGSSESSHDTLTDWMIVDEGTANGPSAWMVSDGKLIQTSNISGGDGLDTDSDRPGTYAVIGNDNWTDLRVTADLCSRNDGSIGLMFRYKDADNYYRFAMDKKRGCRRLIKKVKGILTVLAEDRKAYSRNRWYGIKIELRKNNIKVAVDGKYLFEVKDSSIDSGKIGLYCCENAGSEFRNISVTSGSAGDVLIPDNTLKTTGDTSSPVPPAAPPIDRTDYETSNPMTTSKASRYRIGPEDVLFISVWKDEALTNQVVVLPDGTITLPLVGQIQAAGKTVAALKAELEEKLTHYLPDPTLTVMVQQMNSMQIYIIGRVNRPGSYPLYTRLDVLQALSIAGGVNPFADRKKIKIFRNSGEQEIIFRFNYDEVTKEEKLDQNIELKRGDTIVVP